MTISDDVDSAKGDNDFAVFKNVFNDYFAKDTSKKIRAVNKLRGTAGEHITSRPPYGYIKDESDRKKWIVDEDAAIIVRRIFDLCIAGKGPMKIAKILTAEKVLTVTAYNAKQNGCPLPDNLYRWNSNAVVRILERMEYLGCTVNFKTYTKSLKYKKQLSNPKENWLIFENTQPAIIEKGQWERVQQLRSNKRRPTKASRSSLFSGLMRCADCGERLHFRTANTTTYRQDHFVCSTYKKIPDSCTIHYIRELTLREQVLRCIQASLTYVNVFREDFKVELLKQDTESRKAQLKQKRKVLSEAQKRMNDLDTLIQRTYEDNVLGKLPDARYLKLSTEYEQEQQELVRLTDALAREIETEAAQMVDMDKFFALAEKYADITELTAPLVNELIEKIVVHNPIKIDGRKHVTIEIFFTYVGKIRIPLSRNKIGIQDIA